MAAHIAPHRTGRAKALMFDELSVVARSDFS